MPRSRLALALLITSCAAPGERAEQRVDVLVYGGTSAGVAAAVQVARSGRRALLVEPGAHLGGLSSGGLGATDIGNKAAIGGLAREFYARVKAHYARPDAWTRQAPEDYLDPRRSVADDAMWTFEPHVAERIFDELVAEAGVEVLRGERLDLDRGVELRGTRISSIRTESGRVLRARVFVDASYEGDLMALAGVSYRVGREWNEEHDETLNGVQTANAVHHQFARAVDPHVVPGDPSSGLLPGFRAEPLPADGSGDAGVQAYNFRLCLTDAPENRRPFTKPADYDPLEYELLLRHFDAGATRVPWSRVDMPNRKTDVNNSGPVSTDFIGRNHGYPDGTYAEREAFVRELERYTLGLLWCLANEPRVPEAVRGEVSRWGFCADEFDGGLSHQPYVREARRMIGELVMTQHHCQGRELAADPVGLAAYTMDSHHVWRHVVDGAARNEGDVQVGGFAPYPIGYGAIVPRREECTNLLVPVCLSATHIAFGSIRMEPVFLVLGQSAGTAACLAIEQDVPVQRVDREALRERLLADGQALAWRGDPSAKGRPLPAGLLAGLVVDDPEAELDGPWVASASTDGYVGVGYRHNDRAAATATYRVRAGIDGVHELRLVYPAHSNRASAVEVRVSREGAPTERFTVDQRVAGDGPVSYAVLGRHPLEAGEELVVRIVARPDRGYAVVDAVQLLAVGE